MRLYEVLEVDLGFRVKLSGELGLFRPVAHYVQHSSRFY